MCQGPGASSRSKSLRSAATAFAFQSTVAGSTRTGCRCGWACAAGGPRRAPARAGDPRRGARAQASGTSPGRGCACAGDPDGPARRPHRGHRASVPARRWPPRCRRPRRARRSRGSTAPRGCGSAAPRRTARSRPDRADATGGRRASRRRSRRSSRRSRQARMTDSAGRAPRPAPARSAPCPRCGRAREGWRPGRCRACAQVGRVELLPRLVVVGSGGMGDAPPRHRAVRVVLGRPPKAAHCLLVGERVAPHEPAVEPALRLRRARRNRERTGAEIEVVVGAQALFLLRNDAARVSSRVTAADANPLAPSPRRATRFVLGISGGPVHPVRALPERMPLPRAASDRALR